MNAEAERTGGATPAFGCPSAKSVDEARVRGTWANVKSLDGRLAEAGRTGFDVQSDSAPPYRFYDRAEPVIGPDVAGTSCDLRPGRSPESPGP